MKNLAVIGLDAYLAGEGNIDRLERCIYKGKPGSFGRFTSRERFSHIKSSLDSLIEANALSPENVDLLLLDDGVSDTDAEKLGKLCHSFELSRSLGVALERADEILVRQPSRHVAIIALNMLDGQAEPVDSLESISFDIGFSSYRSCEGVAGIMLTDMTYAGKEDFYIYSAIRGFSSADDIATACAQALNDSSFTVNDVKLVEATSPANAKLAEQEMKGLIKAYNTDNRLQTAVSSMSAILGNSGFFSELCGLVKTVIALYQRYYPGLHTWNKPASPAWHNSPFYFPTESRPCFPNSNGKPLVAAYSAAGKHGYCHIVLQENQAIKDRHNGYMACSDLILVPVVADSEHAMLEQISVLEQKLKTYADIRALATEYYEQQKNSSASYCLCLIAENTEELDREIELAKSGVVTAFQNNSEWKTPKGSFFTSEVVSDDGQQVTFMYPGIGATYIGLGQEIFHLFPEIYWPVAELADDIGSSLKDTILNPRTLEKPDFKALKAMDHAFRASLADIAECGVGFACVFTKIFEEVFKVNADFSCGYSMGEISMYAALGCWKRPGDMSQRLAQSDTFNHNLTGELKTLVHHWDLPADTDGTQEKLWETYTLKATPEEVAEACEDEDRVYCTIINTPDSLVIGGYPEACERVLKKLGARGMALDIQNAIHSAPAFKEYEEMEKLFFMEVNDRLDTRIYSSSCYLPVPQRSKAIANSIAKCLCDPVDFPRLINTMHDKGARVFIEMGPGRSLCSWVDKILRHDGHKPHVSVPVNAKGTSDELTIVRAIAKLLSHGVNIDIGTLYYGSLIQHRQHIKAHAIAR